VTAIVLVVVFRVRGCGVGHCASGPPPTDRARERADDGTDRPRERAERRASGDAGHTADRLADDGVASVRIVACSAGSVRRAYGAVAERLRSSDIPLRSLSLSAMGPSLI